MLYGGAVPVYAAATTISIGLGASADALRFKTNPYMFDEAEKGAVGWRDADERLFEKLSDDQQIRLTGAKKLDVALSLPNLNEARKALETCEDDLLSGWGIDARQSRLLRTGAIPANYPGRWVTNDDYPRADFVKRNEGTTTFLLTVGADGAVAGCRIIASSGFVSLDRQTCALLLGRAAFHPAKDATDQPVPSFYVNRIRWQVP